MLEVSERLFVLGAFLGDADEVMLRMLLNELLKVLIRDSTIGVGIHGFKHALDILLFELFAMASEGLSEVRQRDGAIVIIVKCLEGELDRFLFQENK